MGKPRRAFSKVFVLAVLMSAAVACDSSGLGGFSRVRTARLAVLASVDSDDRLHIIEEIPIGNAIQGPHRPESLAGTGSDGPRTLNDPFDYEPAINQVYWMVLSPSVTSHQNPEAGEGQYSVLYLHDPDTDLPDNSFPSWDIQGDISPHELLDCMRTEAGTETRFTALIAGIESLDWELFYTCARTP